MPVNSNFSQTTFMGASVVNFTASMGLNEQTSSLSVLLVEDPVRNEVFTPPVMGSPCYFSFSDFSFGGILQNWEKRRGTDGNPLYEVTLSDPRELLDGVQLILSGYTGATDTVPNLINVFGYLENIRFGNAGVNEAGMVWNFIKDTVQTLLGDPIGFFASPTYGGPRVKFRQYSFAVDISQVPSVLPYYRIQDSSISLLQAIVQVCQDTGYDCFFEMQNTILGHLITVKTISRKIAPPLGQLTNYISDPNNQVNSSSVGVELRNEVTNKFLVGGQREDLFQISHLQYDVNGKLVPRYYGGGSFLDETTPFPPPVAGLNQPKQPQSNFFSVNNGGDFLVNGTTIGTFDEFGYLLDTSTDTRYRMSLNSNIIKQDNTGLTALFATPTLVFDKGVVVPSGSTILPYYGLDVNGNAIVSLSPHTDYDVINIDSRAFNVIGVGATYLTSTYELRAALKDQKDWESYMEEFSPLIAEQIGIVGIYKLTDVASLSLTGNPKTDGLYLLNGERARIVAGAEIGITSQQENIDRMYQHILSFAQEYYGRKYMVSIPNVAGTYEPDTGRIIYSHEPTDSGFMEDDSSPLGLPSAFNNIFTTPDGKFKAFVRFDASNYLDASQFTKETYAVAGPGIVNGLDMPERLFVLVDVDPQIVFLNKATLQGPRVVITLPYPISESSEDQQFAYYTNMWKRTLINRWVTEGKRWLDIEIGADVFIKTDQDIESPDPNWMKLTPFELDHDLPPVRIFIEETPEELVVRIAASIQPGASPDLLTPSFTSLEDRIDDAIGKRVDGFYSYGEVPPPRVPNFAAIPLKSNTQTYGPWFINGAIGKLNFEQDDSLVPWNYGSYSVMDLVARARIDEGITDVQASEAGQITVPGAPSLNLGGILQTAGPNVTSIDVSVGSDGVKTTYRMRTYTPPKLSALSKANLDRFLRIENTNRELRRNIRQKLSGPDGFGRAIQQRGAARFVGTDAVVFPQSPHPVLVGGVTVSSGDRRFTSVSSMSAIEGGLSLGANDDRKYKSTAYMSVDGIFRPFSIDSGNYLMGHFERPTAGASLPTVLELNPFSSGNIFIGSGQLATDISQITSKNQYDTDNQLSVFGGGVDPNTIRGIGLRAPIILTGWGYDTDGKPVPNAYPNSPTEAFVSGYRNKPQLWKTGPLDARWDNDRKVWVASGGDAYDMHIVISHSGLFSPSSRPRYVVRPVDSLTSDGRLTYVSQGLTLPMSGAADKLVFNLQEGANDLHTLGVGSPVLIFTEGGVNFINELPRSFARFRDL